MNLKGFFTGSTEPSLAEEYSLLLAFFSIPLAATVNFMVLRIGQIAPLLSPVDHFGPIHDTITLKVAATGIER